SHRLRQQSALFPQVGGVSGRVGVELREPMVAEDRRALPRLGCRNPPSCLTDERGAALSWISYGQLLHQPRDQRLNGRGQGVPLAFQPPGEMPYVPGPQQRLIDGLATRDPLEERRLNRWPELGQLLQLPVAQPSHASVASAAGRADISTLSRVQQPPD